MLPGEISGSARIPINIEETSTVGESFNFGIGRIIEIILMGPVFAVIYYILIKDFFGKVDSKTGRNKIYIYILEIGVVVFICILTMGHITHLMFDYANYLYREVDPGIGYNTNPLFLFLYHSDEWLGHHLIHISLWAFIVLALIGESLRSKDRTMKWYEIIFASFLGVGLFIMSGYATYEGQCAWLLMVLSAILLGLEGIWILWKKINPLRYPILFASVIGNIIIIGFYIYWILTVGSLPYYPFAPQP